MRRRRPVAVRRRLRRRFVPGWFRRHRLVYWFAALALAGGSSHLIASTLEAAQTARARWGDSRSVLVAQKRLETGHVVRAGDVAAVSWPVAVVPRGAVESEADAVGRTAVDVVEPGEAVLADRLAPAGLRGVAALVPAGWRALAIPAGAGALPLSVGDRVDLVAAVNGVDAGAAGASPSFLLADDALVVAVDEQSVTVAVTADDAPRVALGIVTDSVVPALRSS